MKITALVENQSECELKPKHGLSLYIETDRSKILFDVGPDQTLFANAEKRKIDLSQVDTVIISHGHLDHGGALGKFFEINHKAKVYIQRSAFEPHYTKVLGIPFFCGIKEEYKNHPQVVLVDGDYKINEQLELFIVRDRSKCFSPMNNALYAGKVKDDFLHEQNLIIHDKNNVLIMGCGHSGVVNIMNAARKFKPAVCIGGYHLMNPNTFKTVPHEFMDEMVKELSQYPETQFYTCHCTGKKAFDYLSSKMSNLQYLSCGKTIEC